MNHIFLTGCFTLSSMVKYLPIDYFPKTTQNFVSLKLFVGKHFLWVTPFGVIRTIFIDQINSYCRRVLRNNHNFTTYELSFDVICTNFLPIIFSIMFNFKNRKNSNLKNNSFVFQTNCKLMLLYLTYNDIVHCRNH